MISQRILSIRFTMSQATFNIFGQIVKHVNVLRRV